MTTFKPNGLDSTSIGMRFIYSIEEDKEGNIWTSGPILSRYSVTENKFINFTRDKIVPFPRVDVNVVHGDIILVVIMERFQNFSLTKMKICGSELIVMVYIKRHYED